MRAVSKIVWLATTFILVLQAANGAKLRTMTSADTFDDELYIPDSADARIERIRICEDNGYLTSLTTFWTDSGYRTNSLTHGSLESFECSIMKIADDECVRQVDIVSKDHIKGIRFTFNT